MKFHLELGPEFNNQIIGVRFILCFVAATVQGTVGKNCATHRRIKLEASFGESQHASSEVWSNDIQIEDIPEMLVRLSNSIAEFSNDQRFGEAANIIRDLANANGSFV